MASTFKIIQAGKSKTYSVVVDLYTEGDAEKATCEINWTDSNGNTVYSKIYPVADPVTNDDWNNLKPYIFTLTNTGSLPLYVSIFFNVPSS